MTIQWTADTYEGSSLSETKKADYKRVVRTLLHDALQYYQKFDSSAPREMDSKRWKVIDSFNDMTVYRERNPTRHVVKDVCNGSAGWQMPCVIVGTGTLAHNMEDILYGVAGGDEAAFLQSVGYSGQLASNSQIISTIETPTLEHPYRTTVLEWSSGCPSPALRGVAKDRDCVYIRANGIYQVGEGERIGYNFIHSVDLPSTCPLQGQGIIRGRVSSCILFKQVADQSVEVFITGYYEVIGSNYPESVAAMIASYPLTIAWTSGQCAKGKKLSWLLQRKELDKNDVVGLIGISDVEDKSNCRTCNKRFGPMRKAYPCTLCESSVCGKCILPMEVLDVIPKLKLAKKKVRLCPNCDHFISQVNPYKVAQQEIRAGRYEEGEMSTILNSSRVSQLMEGPSALLDKDTYAGEVYELGPEELDTSAQSSVEAFARLTSSSDGVEMYKYRRPSDGGCLERGTEEDEYVGSENLIANVWRENISNLHLNYQERDRQLAWLKMTELRLRQDESVALALKLEEGNA